MTMVVSVLRARKHKTADFCKRKVSAANSHKKYQKGLALLQVPGILHCVTDEPHQNTKMKTYNEKC